LDEINRLISKYTKDWPIDRMANVDRCLLRIAICEILYFDDIPPSVSVDEAVELAKKYSTADSGRFINGVLGSLIKDLAGDTA
jgi:N utilization substance protein B